MSLDIDEAAEVIVPAFSFFATAGVVQRLGARPVFVDICPLTYNATADTIMKSVTARTRAVMPVYLFGQMTDMSLLKHEEQRFDVIEDAAQSFGARFENMGLAQNARLAATSFFPTKNLGGMGDGGAVLTFDEALFERVRMLRVHGAKPKYTHHVVGGNFRLDALQAALLRVKLAYLEAQIEARRQLAHQYDELFRESGLAERGLCTLPFRDPRAEHTFNQYVVRAKDRDHLRTALSGKGISSMVYYPSPLHLQPCFRHLGYAVGDFPHAERACQEVLALPCFPGMNQTEQFHVVREICTFYGV